MCKSAGLGQTLQEKIIQVLIVCYNYQCMWCAP